MNDRHSIADLLKGIAVLLMIQVHIVELFATPAILNSHIGKMLLFLGGSPVAPVFVFMLGYFLASSKKSSKQLILRGVKIVSLGMLLNLVLNINLMVSVYKGIFDLKLMPYVFGADILHLAGISIIVITLLKKVIERSILFTVACIFMAAFFGHYLLNYVPDNVQLRYFSAFFYGSTTWSYFPLFPWIAYPLTGIAFYQLMQKFDIQKIKAAVPLILIVVLFLFFLGTTFLYAVSISSNLQSYYHHGLKFFLWTILFLAFYGFFANEINKFIGNTIIVKYINWLGKNVTILYVIQWIIIGNTATEIYKTVSSPLCLLLYFVGILTLSSLLCMVFLKVKERLKKAPVY